MSLTGTPPVLLGNSPAMELMRVDIESAARTNAKVLITGETGVGKEVVARLIHEQGARSRQTFVAVNCSGIPETLLASELFGHARGSFTGAFRDKIGLVRQADRGTLFLDELGEMSLAMQAVLLRFTETGEIQPVGVDAPAGRTDVRLITATNRDLRAQIAVGAFREDLYYRLNVIEIRVPPLRDRGPDVLELFRHYLQQACEAHRLGSQELTTEAEQVLLEYEWPGNVRELRNITERLALRDSNQPITAADLALDLRSARVGGRETALRQPPQRGPMPSRPRFSSCGMVSSRAVTSGRWCTGHSRHTRLPALNCLRSSIEVCSGLAAAIGRSSSSSTCRPATTSGFTRSSISRTATCR